jgi:hypothetical protein
VENAVSDRKTGTNPQTLQSKEQKMFAKTTKTPTDTICLNDASGTSMATPFIVEQKRRFFFYS